MSELRVKKEQWLSLEICFHMFHFLPLTLCRLFFVEKDQHFWKFKACKGNWWSQIFCLFSTVVLKTNVRVLFKYIESSKLFAITLPWVSNFLAVPSICMRPGFDLLCIPWANVHNWSLLSFLLPCQKSLHNACYAWGTCNERGHVAPDELRWESFTGSPDVV